MDQHAGAQHMKRIYFKGCLFSLCSQNTCTQTDTNMNTHSIKLRGHISVGGISISNSLTAETGENGQSIIIRREEQRWQRKKATLLSLRCRDNKIRPRVIHLKPLLSAPHPPTTMSAWWCAQPLYSLFSDSLVQNCYFRCPAFKFRITLLSHQHPKWIFPSCYRFYRSHKLYSRNVPQKM